MSLATHTKKEGLNTLEMRGIQTKLDRAQESLEGLSSRIEFHCANEKVRLETATRQATDPDAGYQEPETVYEYSIAVGEIAYNLRSALDHLIWQLVRANGSVPTIATSSQSSLTRETIAKAWETGLEDWMTASAA